MSAYTVVCDACVLYPFYLRDVLVELAARDVYRARWSDAIHDEWIGSLLKNGKGTPERFARTRELMNTRVLDSLVTDFEHLIPAIDLPDPDDRHVVAAAVKASADAIVTMNLGHFPQERLAQYEIEALAPDDFLKRQFDIDPRSVCEGVRAIRQRLKNPPLDPPELIEGYAARGLAKFAARLRTRIDEI